ncbi:hypothetical protein AB0D94_11535 [Streptomyces sp. NPDC048255]|uniref:hypothetical protein n=1 Tax=Streptomyces sp. NPDC048255 TaxID=3154713 RepID=UPI0033C1B3E9
MTVVILEHAPGEGPHAVGGALAAARLDTRVYRAWAGDLPEDLAGVDAVVVVGGPPRRATATKAPSWPCCATPWSRRCPYSGSVSARDCSPGRPATPPDSRPPPRPAPLPQPLARARPRPHP